MKNIITLYKRVAEEAELADTFQVVVLHDAVFVAAPSVPVFEANKASAFPATPMCTFVQLLDGAVEEGAVLCTAVVTPSKVAIAVASLARALGLETL